MRTFAECRFPGVILWKSKDFLNLPSTDANVASIEYGEYDRVLKQVAKVVASRVGGSIGCELNPQLGL